MGEEALFEIEPDALDRIQFGRVGRQWDQCHVGGDNEGGRAMPTRLIEDHNAMFVLGNRFGELVEKCLHRGRIDIGHDECEGIIRARLHGREDVGESEALVAASRWALTPLPPDVADTAFLADPRLILKEEAYALVFVRTLNIFQQRRGSF